MTIAGALALTAVVLTIAAIVAGTFASQYKHWEPEYGRRTLAAATLTVLAGVGYIAAIWTHALT